MFEHVEPAPPDAILGLTEAFKKDAHSQKINLGVGVYQNDKGITPVLASVKEAEQILLSREKSKSYLPISGDQAYGRLVQQLLFGEGSDILNSGRLQTAQTTGGTGALRIGAELLKLFYPNSTIWMSAPTWANHKGIFSAAGFKIREYPYYHAEEKGLDIEGMKSGLNEVSENDVVLLHVCCHNPSGVDPSKAQWEEIASLLKAKRCVPFLDFAYQGFKEGMDEDRLPITEFLGPGSELFVASSFSKNFGLYQDRVGALTFVARTPESGQATMSHIKKIIRVSYSNPPAHGSHIVVTVLTDKELRLQWERELEGMRERIRQTRVALVNGLKQHVPSQDFSFVQNQHGMFSFSGLTDEQVDWLRTEKSIYIVKGGRMNVAGVTSKNIEYLCDSLGQALERTSVAAG